MKSDEIILAESLMNFCMFYHVLSIKLCILDFMTIQYTYSLHNTLSTNKERS